MINRVPPLKRLRISREECGDTELWLEIIRDVTEAWKAGAPKETLDISDLMYREINLNLIMLLMTEARKRCKEDMKKAMKARSE